MSKKTTLHVEESIIGSLISCPELFAPASKNLEPAMFKHHKSIYTWMLDMDVTKMMSWDVQLITSVFGDVSSLLLSAEPETIEAASAYLKEEYDRERDTAAYVSAATMLQIDSPYNVREYVLQHIGDDSEVEAEKSRGQEMFEAWQELESGEAGVETVWPDMNRITGGVRRGQTGIMAGTTGTGKTQKALALLLGLAKSGKPCAFFSIELTKQEVWQRVYCIESGLSMETLSSRRFDQVQKKYVLDLTKAEYKQLTDAMQRIAQAPFYVVDAKESTNKATILRQKNPLAYPKV